MARVPSDCRLEGLRKTQAPKPQALGSLGQGSVGYDVKTRLPAQKSITSKRGCLDAASDAFSVWLFLHGLLEVELREGEGYCQLNQGLDSIRFALASRHWF